MGRAIVREPRAFLMDEPLSHLDAKLRVEMRAEISRIQRDLGVTTIYVTHDQVEAMTMGDRVAVLRGGHLQQIASPQELYDRPVNLFVAEFIGSPAMNLVRATLGRDDGEASVRFAEHSLTVPSAVVSARAGLERYAGREVVLGIRPEDLEDASVARPAPGANTLSVEVDIREDMGSEVVLHFAVAGDPVETEEVLEAMEEEDVADAVHERSRRGVPFIARVERATAAREGKRLDLAVVTERLHFFDPETGLGIYD
jgi:multiple sugar transport system ATP-binding protein